jgi:tetratricopeptide (TPR) repeat protein
MAKSISLRQENRYEDALRCLDEALKIDPNFFPVLVQRGIVLDELARYDEAVESFDRFLKFINLPHVHQLREKSLLNAIADCERILAKNPEDVDALLKKGDILQWLHRYYDAVESYNRVLEIEAENIDALNRRGNAFLELDRHEDALESYDRALKIAPHKTVLSFNRGNVLRQLGRLDEALEAYGRALSYKPGLAEAVMEQSHCNLTMGNFRPGWRQYESRWQTDPLKGKKFNSHVPLWLGEEQLCGKTILLWAEQGFGDAIQFLRYVPLVAQMAGHVIVRVSAVLKSLTGTLQCPVSIVTPREPLPFHDFQCPLMSLPLAFGTTLESIPADIPYLGADFDMTEKWQKLLGPRDKPRIGIVWAGRQHEPLNRTRDIPLEALQPLANLGVEIISLQKQIPEKDRQVLESMPHVRNLGETLVDFADTAALIENLDMVVSTDTAVAHLAGALGKPVWIMLRYSGEWRWLRDRSDSPWYPTARIFRQKVHGDWAGVVGEITRQLQSKLGGEW